MLFKRKEISIRRKVPTGVFPFRIVKGADGNDIIDDRLMTPYNSLNPIELAEYEQIDSTICKSKNNMLIIEPSIFDTLKCKLRKALV